MHLIYIVARDATGVGIGLVLEENRSFILLRFIATADEPSTIIIRSGFVMLSWLTIVIIPVTEFSEILS